VTHVEPFHQWKIKGDVLFLPLIVCFLEEFFVFESQGQIDELQWYTAQASLRHLAVHDSRQLVRYACFFF